LGLCLKNRAFKLKNFQTKYSFLNFYQKLIIFRFFQPLKALLIFVLNKCIFSSNGHFSVKNTFRPPKHNLIRALHSNKVTIIIAPPASEKAAVANKVTSCLNSASKRMTIQQDGKSKTEIFAPQDLLFFILQNREREILKQEEE
jgi:hypothetical protein